jgi:hypothetical protein
MGWVRVAVTRIEHDGTMHRRMVDTVQQSDPRNWEDLTALAAQPPYRPVPGTDVYHICADGYTVQVGEYDLEGPLRDLVTVVLAGGSKMLLTPASSGPGWRTITRAQRLASDDCFPPSSSIVAESWRVVVGSRFGEADRMRRDRRERPRRDDRERDNEWRGRRLRAHQSLRAC